MKKGLRRVAAVAVAALVVAPALATAASATPTFAFDRLAGIDRYATSVATATTFGASTSVILANGDNKSFPDALTASYLAGEKNAPILLTKRDATPANILARITASGATTVYLVGGEGVISAAQATALDATFGTVTRLGGLDRYLTAQAVIADAGVATSTTAILATGVNFPDAIAGGPLSYVKGMPLAITATNTLPAATLAALKTAGTTNVIVLGGPTVVTPAVLATLAANGITLNQRIFGDNRSETSSDLAEYMVTSQGFSNTGVNVASGYAFGGGADALGGGALSGKENRPTLITESVTTVGPGVIKYLTDHAATLANGHIFGGTGAVSAASQTAMETAARAVGSNQTYTVTPTDTAVVPFGAAAAGTTRIYTASVPAGAVVDIALFEADNLTVGTTGVVTFADTDQDNVADVGDIGNAVISHVNGVVSDGDGITSTGTITFSVTSDDAATVRPVIFADAANDDDLNLVVPTIPNANPKQPSDVFGIGGVTIFTPVEAPLGTTTVSPVGVADTENNFIANGVTYFYDANDVYQYSGISITLAQFESIISAGDIVTVTYNPDAAGVSTFNLTTDLVGTVAAPTVAVVNLDAGATINDVQATFSPAPNASSGTTYQLLDGGVVVAGTTQAAGTVVDTLVITALNVATGSHVYSIRATNPVSTVTTDGTAAGAVTTPGTADGTGPGSIFLSQTNGAAGLGGTLDSGDTIKVVFDEPMAAPNNGDKIRFTDADGTIVDATCGTNATCTRNAAAEIVDATSRDANTVLTLVLTADPTVITAGTIAGEQVASGAVTDQAGNTDLAGNAWDLAAIVSTDKALA